MGLADIADELGVTTTTQEERGVATVDDTDVDLDARLRDHADKLPCTPEAAATVLERHAAGDSVGDAAEAAIVAPVTAAKVLHRAGIEGVTPLAPTARQILRDWLAGQLSRADALELTGADDAEFALAAYIETHDPVPELADATRRDAAASLGGDALVKKREELADTMSASTDLF
ncbi:hypothetical protein GL213_00400 [Halogeometricum borinquense]|uniref:Uncharacterized protein n=2 Tax=Halogeometricum borinquense TaxID=60847 RepID=E4NRL6_HALBP|nr:hypothetical protein [Halogeometricum borinquense]ADQ65692.1 hypothetical protein Hbor_00790 [Halogeometricum borinquense DSM 11551]ELY27022.1 hypothetical protein C499_10819 [Halogeometricum borinquense DSM 11551]QIB72906.1 hypothetical protein G3I44_00555 [Halogeometricum borinquense]QIQ75136.1 hypothetical protein GL213_00400 [Halogeometricum borinquense]RYJ15118.1 hypothetical protein ELS19_14975 [Halogeometricum borinquense]